MKKILASAAFLLLGYFAQAQNGLENIVVEKYYVSNAADAAKSKGALPVGSVTYRVYADMLPGYKFQLAYGNAAHQLKIQSSTAFFNNEDRGATTPTMTKTQDTTNTVALDSWLSVGGAASGQLGILKSEDNGVANLVNHSGILKGADAYAGIPLTVQDGLIAGSPQTVTFVGIPSGDLDVFGDESNAGSSFMTSNGAWSSLNGSTGPTTANKVLIGQFTTNGAFSFQLNIQIGTPTGGTQKYVSSNPGSGETQMASLVYTSCPMSIGTTGAISGLATVCKTAGNKTAYTTTALSGAYAGAVTYLWTVPTGATIVSGQGSPSIVVTYATSFTTGNITVTAQNPCSTSTTTSLAVTAGTTGTPKAVSAVIAALADMCAVVGSANTTNYSVAVDAAAGSYLWTVTGGTIAAGQGTNSIDVTFPAGYDGKGNVTAATVSSCGTATAPKKLDVKYVLPAAPKSIVGLTNPAPIMGTTTKALYSCTSVSGATYKWTLPAGVKADSTGPYTDGNDSIQVTYTNAFVSGSVSVQAVYNCGLSKATALAIARKAPASPASVTGSVTVCTYVNTATTAPYTCASSVGATYYLWTAPANATIASGQGTTNVQVSFASGFAGGDLTVAAVDGFGGTGQIASAVKKLTIKTPVIPHAPIEIIGQTGVCGFINTGSTTYAIAPIPATNSYLWVAPAGATIVSGQGTTSIVVSFNNTFTTGDLTVASVSGCGTSAATKLTLTSRPAVPVISGFLNVCATTTTNYSVALHAGSSYSWATDAKGAVLANASTNSVDITWAAATGKVTVIETGCTQTATSTITVKKAACKLVDGQLVPDENATPELSVYPNPSQGNGITMLLTGLDSDKDGANTVITMYDLIGKVVYSSQKVYTKGVGITETIDTKEIVPGMYFLTVKVAEETYNQKVVISQ